MFLSTTFLFTKVVSMEILNKKCRLCYTIIIDENFKVIDEVLKDILDTLLFKLALKDETQHLICNTCSEKLFAAYNFKWMCLSTNNIIIPHLEESSSIDLKGIYVKEEGSNMLDDKQICRLCMQPANDAYFSLQDVQTDIIQVYIPEIKFKMNGVPIICKVCYDSLFIHSSFIKNCLNVKQGTYHNESLIMGTRLNDSYIKTEKFEIEQEEENEGNKEKYSETHLIDMQLTEEFKQEIDPSLNFFGNETNINNTEQCSPEVLQQMEYSICNENNSYAYKKHSHEIENQENNDFITYQNLSELHPYKFGECEFESKHQRNLSIHQFQYKCTECEFETKYKKVLRKHELIHKDPLEVKLYKCCECEYETIIKKYLVKHVLRHKDHSEIELYKCSECEYESRYKNNLKKHLFRHSDASETQMHKCSDCDYETKIKGNLAKHQLKHKDATEVKMYMCGECKFESKYKHCLETHQLRHKDASEVKMHKCGECEYETKFKRDLRKHELRHKDQSEIKMYKCSECEYESRYKSNFRLHQLMHKDPSEVQMHKCSECQYETRYKRYLKLHHLKHKHTSELQTYQCCE